MGDPLSIAAGVIAVLGAAQKVSQGLGSLKAAKNAPEGLENLLSRVSSIESVLEAIRDSSMDPENLSPGMRKVLDMAKNKFIEMEGLLEYSLTQAGTSSKVDRWQWLRKRGEAENLLSQLDGLRNDLAAHFGIQNSIHLQEFSVYTKESWTSQQQFNEEMTNRFARSEAALAFICNQIEASPATQVGLASCLGGFRKMSISSASETVALSSDQVAMTTNHDAEERPRFLSRNEFRIQTFRQLQSCTRACPCTCHHFRQIRPPSSTVGVFGRGSLGLKGPLFGKQSCNIRSCKGESGLSITIKYFLPTWLSQRMLYGWFTSTPLCGPELLLRTFRVVDSDEDPLFQNVIRCSLDEVKRLLAKGTASPYIVDKDGSSLLYEAFISAQDTAIPRLLLDIGLDLEHTNYFEMSPLDILFIQRRYELYNASWRKWFESLRAIELEDLDYLCDQRGFSDLHKIVWGVSREDLYTKVQANRASLNYVDVHGFTALSYACILGEWQYVGTLLKCGADTSSRPQDLFWIAVWSQSYQCIKLLIDSGVGPCHWTTSDLLDDGMDNMADLASYPYERYITGDYSEASTAEIMAIDKLMLLHGFDFKVASADNQTALILNSKWFFDFGEIRMKLLLESGVNTEAVDSSNGYTALHYAVKHGRVGVLNMLVQYGARLDARTSHGDTILHLAVSCSDDLSFIQALSEVGLSDISLDTRNDDGNTAFDLLQTFMRDGMWFHIPFNDQDSFFYSVEDHIATIRALEALFHKIQEQQDIPPEQRYAPLKITEEDYNGVIYAVDSDSDSDSDDPTKEPLIAMPGSWPEPNSHSLCTQ